MQFSRPHVSPPGEVENLRRRSGMEASQGELWDIGDPKEPLEPMPVDFHYLVRYGNEKEPRRLKTIDWEVNQAWRKWRHEYENPDEAVRNKWLNEVAGDTRDVSFFVGNLHRFLDQFVLFGCVLAAEAHATTAR